MLMSFPGNKDFQGIRKRHHLVDTLRLIHPTWFIRIRVDCLCPLPELRYPRRLILCKCDGLAAGINDNANNPAKDLFRKGLALSRADVEVFAGVTSISAD